MILDEGYYLINATKQPNEIYPISNICFAKTFDIDRWGVSEIRGEISDTSRNTVDSISVLDRCWITDRGPIFTACGSPWSISRQLQGTVGTVGKIETVKSIPIYVSCDTAHYDITSGIKKVIFHDPATIVLWEDGTKTVVKCQEGDTYSKEVGLAMCMLKKFMGNKGNFNNVFKKYCEGDEDE